jgi:MinD-like ATPase involved in chromosome partitioning or flagellar assembly
LNVSSEVTIALVFTPDAWVEQLHRHCTDHGGARVRQVLIDPALALEDSYDVLVVSHRWMSLTMGFVDDLHRRGRLVLGVYEREEMTGAQLLASVGVDGVVASDAGPAGIVAALRSLRVDGVVDAGRRRDTGRDVATTRRAPITVVAGTHGAGSTEVAIGLALAAGDGGVLVDANDVAPDTAARLGLAIEPNLRSAIEAIEYDGDDIAAHFTALPGGARALAGLPTPAAWPQIRPAEVLRVVETVAARATLVVVDVAGELEDLPVAMSRPRHAVARACVGQADEIVVVANPSPAGVARLLALLSNVRTLAPRAPVHAVVNHAPRDAYRRGELVDEIGGAAAVASVSMLPSDRRVEAAAWAGTAVARGPFTRAVARLAAQLVAVPVEVEVPAALRAAS